MPTDTPTPPPDDLGRRHRNALYAFSGAGIVALVAVSLLVALRGRPEATAKGAARALVAAGCRYRHYPPLQRLPHYLTLHPSPPPQWNSFPPTSGRHYYMWVRWGVHRTPVPLIEEVHNLEHGGVVIQYGDRVPAAAVAGITAFWRADPTALLVAPLPQLGDEIALTAWTQWAECTRFDAAAFRAFRQAFRYHGPESPYLPTSALQPGR